MRLSKMKVHKIIQVCKPDHLITHYVYFCYMSLCVMIVELLQVV